MSDLKPDNNGVGMHPTLSMNNRDFMPSDVDDNNLTACHVVGNNQVGKRGVGELVFGKVVAVSCEVDDNGTPVVCSVQARGVVRFKYNPAFPEVCLGESVETTGDGRVGGVHSGAVRAGKNTVIAINQSTETVDVWLG